MMGKLGRLLRLCAAIVIAHSDSTARCDACEQYVSPRASTHNVHELDWHLEYWLMCRLVPFGERHIVRETPQRVSVTLFFGLSFCSWALNIYLVIHNQGKQSFHEHNSRLLTAVMLCSIFCIVTSVVAVTVAVHTSTVVVL